MAAHSEVGHECRPLGPARAWPVGHKGRKDVHKASDPAQGSQRSGLRITGQELEDCEGPDCHPRHRKSYTYTLIIAIAVDEVLQRKAAEAAERAGQEDVLDFLTYQSSFAVQFATYSPRHIATLGLASMICCIAQMKNARRGHDQQGRLKSIQLGRSDEGYSNFMAPGRVARIAAQAKELGTDEAAKVYTDDVLRPATETYLTAAWDELVPFPTTWKIRFDGFGRSDYSKKGNPFGQLSQPALPDDAPPWYQPQGLNGDEGVFADASCCCGGCRTGRADGVNGGVLTAAEREPTVSTGCGLSHHPEMYQHLRLNGKA